MTTAGNPDTHVILRGGRTGPNYGASHTAKALDLIGAAGLPRRLMVDASHGNSGKDHRRQPVVAASIAEQVAAGEHGLTGVMLESFLRRGQAGTRPPGDPHLRAERHRRVPGLRRHRRRPGRPGRRRPLPP